MIFNIYKHNSTKRLALYGTIGVLAFAVEYGSFTVLIHLLHGQAILTIAQSISFTLGLITSFTGNRFFTFNEKNMDYAHSVSRQISSYAALALINLCLSNIVIYLLVHHANVTPLLAKLVVMLMVVLWNFLIFNKLIFKSK